MTKTTNIIVGEEKTQGQHHESRLQEQLNFKKNPMHAPSMQRNESGDRAIGPTLDDYWRAAARTP